MQATKINPETTVIGQVIAKFTAGDPSMFDLIAEDIDFRIDHFHDDIDTEWQQAQDRQGLMALFARLATEVFPKGTRALAVDSVDLGDGWYLTEFHQAFFYGVRQTDVTSQTFILSHETDGRMDYFRETVTTVQEG